MSVPAPDGFSLAEVLVASAVALLLVGSLLLASAPSQSGFRTQPAAMDVQQRTRVAVAVIGDDLLAAGSGPLNTLGGHPLGEIVPPVLPYRVGLRQAGAPGTFRADAVAIVSAVPGTGAAATGADFAGSSGAVTVIPRAGCPAGRPSCGIEAGETVMLVDESGQWDLFGAATVTGDSVELMARGPVSGRRYAAGSAVLRVLATTYYLRPGSGPDGPQLARYDARESDLPVVDHVVSLAFEYYGDPRPPRPRVPPGTRGEVTTYGPAPPALDEDDARDSWPAGENCVVAIVDGQPQPRLAALGPADGPLQPLTPAMLTDGPWCPDVEAPTRFDADLLRVRKVRVTLRVEAWSDSLRGASSRFFLRPGSSRASTGMVPDQAIVFEIVPRALGGGR